MGVVEDIDDRASRGFSLVPLRFVTSMVYGEGPPGHTYVVRTYVARLIQSSRLIQDQ